MPTNTLAATGVISGTTFQGGLIATLPKDGNTYSGHDPNGNVCRVWADAATGRLLQDGNLNVVWWSAP
jgi:hypothetical protein